MSLREVQKGSNDYVDVCIHSYSDIEFDNIPEDIWETDYQAITRKYTEKLLITISFKLPLIHSFS